MIEFNLFQSALPCSQFLKRYGTVEDVTRWQKRQASITLNNDQKQLLQLFTRQTNVLFLAGAWCGDCVQQCTIVERFAEIAPAIRVRYLDRDEDAAVREDLSINGGHRVPVAIFFSEDGHAVARYGEKTLTQYRKQVSALVGNPWPEITTADAESHDTLIQNDWLRELERVQWILRLSPRLRKLHND